MKAKRFLIRVFIEFVILFFLYILVGYLINLYEFNIYKDYNKINSVRNYTDLYCPVIVKSKYEHDGDKYVYLVGANNKVCNTNNIAVYEAYDVNDTICR